MQTDKFFKALIILIMLGILVQKAEGTYCSAYCSYYNLGAAYTPMCTAETQTTCTKCDESLFTLTSGQCVPHGKFNETLWTTDLMPPISTLTNWYSTNSLYQLNTISGLYSTVEFYQDPSIPAGGSDLLYKIFINLPAHFTVRLRFFVIRSSPSTMQFSYYIDNQMFNYNYNQYPSNTTLGDIIMTDKILHQNVNMTLGFEAIFAPGVTEYIAIKELLIFVSKCSDYCSFCSNSTNCVACGLTSMGNQTFLYNGECYVECPEQTFPNITSQACQPCLAECQNCVGNESNCTQCKFEGRLETFLLNYTCYYTCPNGYFKDFDTNQCVCPVDGYFIDPTTKICSPCANECNSCYGPSKIQCYNCSIGNFLIPGTTWCTNVCPSGQYGDEMAKKCVFCSSTCSECANSPSQCTACFLAKSTRYLYESQCLKSCPTGYAENYALRQCIKCPPYYYSFNGQCLIECPENYVANNETKSCLSITQTNFELVPEVTGIEVLMKGASVSFNVNFEQGLSASSEGWLSSQGYYNTNLNIDQKSVLASNIKIQSENTYSFTFILSEQLDENTLMTIDFGTMLKTEQNISYSQVSAEFSLSSNPEMLEAYYNNSQKNYLNIMFIPALFAMFVLLAMRSKQTYEMLFETIRSFQLMGLAIFISYPLQSPIYSLLQGLNYFNLEFFPNIYNWFVPTFKNSLNDHVEFAGFRFLYGDMDFIRMIGSILVFIAVWVLLIVVLKVFFIKDVLTLGWLVRLGMDFIEVKILHSFWNSLLFTIVVSPQNNIYILWLHLFSYVFMGFTVFRYYKIYQESGSISYPFLWRVIATLLLSIAVYQQMVLLIILSLLSVAFGLQQYRSQKAVLISVEKMKFSTAFKLRALLLSFLPWISILGISILVFYRDQMPALACEIIIGFLGYVIIIINVIVFILMRYYFNLRENIQVKTNHNIDGSASKRILQKEIMEEHLHQRNTPKYDLETILSKDDNNTIVTEKEVFIKDEFGADFHHAHKQTIPDLEDSHRQNETTYERSNYNQSSLGLVESNIKKELPVQQEESRVKPLKKFSQTKNIQSWRNNNETEDESIFEDGPVERKFERGHQTQAIRKNKTKLTPLQTVEIKNEDDTEFEQIELTKRSNPDGESVKTMNAIKLLTNDGFKKFNTVDLHPEADKKDSPGVIYYEKEEPPRRLEGGEELRLRSNVFLRDEQESP